MTAAVSHPEGNLPIEIRRATLADLPAIQDFIDATYGTTAPFKGEARWRWQFLENPFQPHDDPAPTVWIAVSDGRVAGQIAVQDAALRLQGRTVEAGWIVDVMIRPEFRGMGLGHRIHDRVMEDRATLVTLTMAPATRRIAEKAGCVTLGETRQYIRPVRISARTVSQFVVAKTRNKPRLRGIARVFNATRIGPAILGMAAGGGARMARLFRARPAQAAARIEEVEEFPDAVDVLWDAVMDRYPAIFERNLRFLNWRFRDAPGLVYRRFLLVGDNGVRGYVVTRLGNPAEMPLGVIADVFADPADAAAIDALLAHAVAVLSPECEYIEAAASTSAYRRALERAGFVATRRMRPTVVTSDTGVRAAAPETLDGWHFTKADHDWDQVHPL